MQNATAFASSITDNAATVISLNSAQWNMPAMTISGSGTLIKTGSQTAMLGVGGTTTIAMTGGLIDIQGGMLINSNNRSIWTNNKASLEIDSGAVLDLTGNNVWIDALTGTGTFQNGYTQTETLTLGVNGGSGTFSGNLIQTNTASNYNLTVVKNGSGTETLSGTGNNWAGGTQVNAGVLQLGPGAALGSSSGAVTITGGTLDLGGNNQSVSAAVSFQGGTVQNGTINETATAYAGQSGTVTANLTGTVGLTKTTAGTLILGGSNTYGNTTINAGNMVFTSTAATPAGTQNITINNGGALDIAGAYPTALSWLTSGLIVPTSSGALALTANSSENINFSGFSNLSLGAVGTQTYSGVLTQSGTTYRLGGGGGTLVLPGTVLLTDSGSTPQSLVVNGNVTLLGSNTYSGGTTVSSGTLQLGDGVANNGYIQGNIVDSGAVAFANLTSQAWSGAISGGGGLIKAGAGVLTLTAVPAYTGATTVSGGTLSVQNNALASTSIAINAGTMLQYNNSNSITQTTTTISGSGTLQKIGAGTLTFGGGGNVTWNLGAGAVIDVEAGRLTGGSSIQDFWTNDLASLNIAAGALFTGVEANVRIDALTGSGTLGCGYNGAGYVNDTIGVNNGSGTFSGLIEDWAAPMVLVKTGSGTQVFSGANTYSGGTTVNNGLLQLGNNSALGTGGLTVTAGTVDLAGYSPTVAGLSGAAGTITNSGSAGSTLTVNQAAAATFSGTLANGPTNTLALVKAGAGELTFSGAGNYSGGTTVTRRHTAIGRRQ